MAQRSTFPIYNQLAGGELETMLRTMRDENLSYVEITILLREKDIEISPTTVFRWCRDLGIENARAAS